MRAEALYPVTCENSCGGAGAEVAKLSSKLAHTSLANRCQWGRDKFNMAKKTFRDHHRHRLKSVYRVRLFSMGSDIMKSKPSNSTFDNFERFVFMKGNGHLWTVWNEHYREESYKTSEHHVFLNLNSKDATLPSFVT